MTQPILPPELIGTLIQEITARAPALGLTWRLRPGEVIAVVGDGTATVRYDGDETDMRTIILINRVRIGQRVMVIFVPPAGNYIIGTLVRGGDPVVQTFPGTDTWTKLDGLLWVDVEVQAAGGPGGGAPATAAGQTSAGAGGQGGGWARSILLAADLTDTETVTLGAAASGGTGAGSKSPDSSFGVHVVAEGGAGGGILSASATPLIGQGAEDSMILSGQVVANGGGSGGAIRLGATGSAGGHGGNSYMGAGARTTGTGNNGGTGGRWGGGGSGASNNPSGGAKTGGDGGPPIIIVSGYF